MRCDVDAKNIHDGARRGVIRRRGFGVLFLPADAKQTAGRFFTNVAAVVAQSWSDTFGGSYGENAFEIDLAASSSLSSSSADAAAGDTASSPVVVYGAASGDTSAGKSKTVAAGAASAPVVVLQVDTTTATTTASGTADAVAAAPASSSPILSPPPPAQCALTTSAPLSRELIFNEVAWMGSPPLAGESGGTASNREWMELKNISGSALDISNWQMLDAAGNIKIIFDASATVSAGGLLLLTRGADAVPGIAPDKIYTGALSNTGSVLAIVDAACGASDILDASLGWPAGNNATKQTLERDADGFGWHTSVAPGGTPKAENSVVAVNIATSTVANTATDATVTTAPTSTTTTSAVPTSSAPVVVVTVATSTATSTAATSTSDAVTSSTPVAGVALNHLVIAEVQIAGASSTNDFVKIFNPTAAAVDVSGWKLRKKSSTGADYSVRVFPAGSSVAVGGYFMWANAADGFGDSIGANTTSTATLAADNSIALFDTNGTIIDAVAWGEGTNQYAEGAAYPTDPQASQVLKRKSADGEMVDTDNNANDFTL